MAAVTQEPTHVPDTPVELWAVPAFAAPEGKQGRDGSSLMAALDTVASAEPRLEANVTLVPERGEAGIESLLRSTASAAPSALPDIVMLPMASLERAVAEGLVQPVPDSVPRERVEGSFPFALEAATGETDGTFWAVPFAVDVGHMIARDRPVPESWEQAMEEGAAVVVPSGTTPDAAALLTSVYLSGGGDAADMREPSVPDLASAVAPLADSVAAGVMTAAESGETSRGAWNSFLLNKAPAAIVSAAVFASQQANFPALTWGPLPSGKSPAPPSAWGWAFVITTRNAERAEVAGALIDQLTAPEQRSWVFIADYLPAWQEDWAAEVSAAIDPAPSDEYIEFAAGQLAEAGGLTVMHGRWGDWAEVLDLLLSGSTAEIAAAAIAAE
jgi:hypothetical protein